MANKVIKLRNIKRILDLGAESLDEAAKYLISGRVSKVRSHKTLSFIELNDGSTCRQLHVVLDRQVQKKTPKVGSYLTCLGKFEFKTDPQPQLEFQVDEVQYESSQCANYPFSDDVPWNRLRVKQAHLRPRIPNFAALLRLRSDMELALHMIMKQMDFARVHTPILTSNDSEASSDLFLVRRTKSKDKIMEEEQRRMHMIAAGVVAEQPKAESSEAVPNRTVREDYFGKDVYLVTSGQLHLESFAASLSRVYTMSNAFRAENSKTTRHLSEFLMLEAEEAPATDLAQLMDRVESIVKFCGQYLAEVSEHKEDLVELLSKHEHEEMFDKVTQTPFVRMTYDDAVRDLNSEASKKQLNTEYNYKFGDDIGRAEERVLLSHTNQVPIFITNYPKLLKPFYMKTREDDGDAEERALCFDLIAPLGGELCGGSLREDSHDKLQANIASRNSEALEGLQWYLDLRKYGTFPHGGFGLGFERLLQTLTGIENIRDTLAFGRWPQHCPM